MNSLKNKVIMVIDSGSFFELALSLTKDYKEVLYYVQWTSGFPGPEKYRVGTEWQGGKQLDTFDGKNLRRIDSIWNNLDKVDVVLITDVYDGDIADHLRELGYPVCHAGSKGAELELNRWTMLQNFNSAGMAIPNVVKITGLTALKEKLKILKDKYVKISRFRHITETFHHENWELSQPIIEKMEHKLGSLKDTIEFLIWDPIEAKVEVGYDGYSVDGKYPSNTLTGVEIKDKAYYGEIISFNELSKPVQETTNKISPILKAAAYKGFVSTEVRVGTNGKNYLIDMTCRMPMPPSPLYTILFKNLGEIVWNIANGQIIDIIPNAKCGLYATICTEEEESNQPIYFDEKYRDNIKLSYCIKVDGNYSVINVNQFPEIGSVCVIGNSFEECYKKMKEVASTIKGYTIKVDTEYCEKAYEEYKIVR